MMTVGCIVLLWRGGVRLGQIQAHTGCGHAWRVDINLAHRKHELLFALRFADYKINVMFWGGLRVVSKMEARIVDVGRPAGCFGANGRMTFEFLPEFPVHNMQPDPPPVWLGLILTARGKMGLSTGLRNHPSFPHRPQPSRPVRFRCLTIHHTESLCITGFSWRSVAQLFKTI